LPDQGSGACDQTTGMVEEAGARARLSGSVRTDGRSRVVACQAVVAEIGVLAVSGAPDPGCTIRAGAILAGSNPSRRMTWRDRASCGQHGHRAPVVKLANLGFTP